MANARMIVGIDEVGRGCLAGPLCVGAVALKSTQRFVGLRDSKLMTALQRERLAVQIKGRAQAAGLGWATAAELDRLGMTDALRLAVQRALIWVNIDYDEMIIDGIQRLHTDPRAVALPKADSLVPAVSAAAVLAKVARDHYMRRVHTLYEQYMFEQHVGYATSLHRRLLAEYGPSPIHRQSFRPVRDLL